MGASAGTLVAAIGTNLNALSSGAASVGSGSTLQLDNLNVGGINVTNANTFTGSGLLKVNFAAGTTSPRGFYMNNVTAFAGTIELTNAGANADKWAVTGLTAPSATLKIDSGSQLFVVSGTTTFTNTLITGSGNSENRGAIRLIGTLAGTNSLLGNTTIGSEGGTMTGNISSGAAGTQNLTVGTGSSTGNATLSGNIGGGTGTIALTKTAAGTLTLSGLNTYTGNTLVSGGTLVLNGSNAAPLLVVAGSTLRGTGTNAGGAYLGGSLLPGPSSGGPGTLTLGALTLSNAVTLTLDLSTAATVGGGVNDLIQVTGGFTNLGTATVNFNFLAGVPAIGVPYTIITSGALDPAFNLANLTTTAPFPATFSVSGNNIQVTFSARNWNLVWQGDRANNTNWANGTPGWTNVAGAGSLEAFFGLDSVLFDDTSTNLIVNMPGLVVPLAFTNNSTVNNYTITGAGGIGGLASVTKDGASTLTFINTNSYTGPTVVKAGILRLNLTNAQPLATVLSVSNGAVLDLNVSSSGAVAWPSTNTLVGGGTVRLNTGSGANNVYLQNNLSGFTGILDLIPSPSGKVNLGNMSAGPAPSATIKAESGATLFLPGGKRLDCNIELYGGSTGEAFGQYRIDNATNYGPVLLKANTTIGNQTSASYGDIRGIISDGGLGLGFTKQGNGYIVLSTANTFSGQTAFTAGTLALVLNHANALQNSTVNMTVNNGLIFNAAAGTTFTLGGLTGSSAQNLVNNASAAINLSAGNNNASTAFSGVLSGSGSLTKIGSGTLTLNATNIHTGTTYANAGILQLAASGAISNASTILVGANGTFDVSPVTGGFLVRSNQTLAGFGIVTGNVATIQGSIIVPGTAGTAGTLSFSNALALTDATLKFDLTNTTTAGGGVNDLLAMNGSLTLSGTNTIQVNQVAGSLAEGTYTLISGITNIVSGGTANLQLANPLRAATFSFVESAVPGVTNLVMTVGSGNYGSLVWVGTNGFWDLASTYNWTNTASAQPDRFYTYDQVRFDDTLVSSNIVSLVGTLLPNSVTVSNVNTNYTFIGSGSIAGLTGLTKDGTGTLTLLVTNTYAADTIVSRGTLKLGAANVIPDGVGKGNLSLSGTLDMNTLSETINGLSGTGIVDTLAGGAPTLTVGNADASSVFAGSLRNANGALTLTKVGSGLLTLTGTSAYSGVTTVSNGMLQVGTGGAMTLLGALNVGGGATGTLTINGGNVTNSLVSGNALYIGGLASQPGVFNMLSGFLTLNGAAGVLVVGDNAVATYNQQGGTVTVTANGDSWFGNNAGGLSTASFGGGSYTQTLGTMRLGVRANTTVTISNTASVSVPSITFGHPITAGATDTLNLNGGLLTVGAGGIVRASGTPIINLNGGTLASSAPWSSSIAMTLGGTGSTVDTTGGSITLSGGLLGAGGLTKTGGGALTLLATNLHTGPTVVSAGALRITPPVVLPVTSGLVAKLDADALMGLANGDMVNTWMDTSGLGNNATRVNGTPTYQTAELNGRPVVRFPSDGLSWFNFTAQRTDVRTVFMVAKETTTGQHFLLGDSVNYHFHRAVGPTFYLWDGANSSANIRSGTTRMNGAVINGTNTALGTGWNLIDVVTVGNVTVSSVSQDRNNCCGGRSWAGDIAEILIYNVALSATEVQQVENYLNYKWFGVPIPTLVLNGAVSVATDAAFGGNGLAGTATVAPGGIIEGGYNGFGTLTLSNLTFNGAGTVKVTLAAGSAPIVVTNALSVGGLVSVLPLNVSQPADGTYHVLQYFGALTGPFTLTPGHIYTLVTNTAGPTNYLDVVVNSTLGNLTWVGGAPDHTWDVGSTPNWDSPGGQTVFYPADTVRFDDGTSETTVDLAGLLQPTAVNVVADQDYLFEGSGVINGGSLNKSGGGTLTLANSGTNTLVVGTLVSAGTLRIGNGGTVGVLPVGPLTNDATVVFDRSDDVTNSSAITGAGYVRKDGANTLTLSGANTHGGGTVISNGTLKLGNNRALGNIASAITTVSNGATLDVSSYTFSEYAQPIIINGPGVAPAVGALTKSYSPAGNGLETRFITLGSDASMGGVAGARIDIGRSDWGNNTVNPPVRLDGQGHTLSLVGNIYFGILAGATNLAGVIVNTNTLIAPHGDNSFAEAIVTLNGGTLSPWGANHVFTNSLVINSGYIDNQGFGDTYTGPIQINGPVTITVTNNNAGNITFAGNVTGVGNITKTGPNSLLLSGDNSGFNGALTNNQSNTFFTNAVSGSASATWVLNNGNLANTTPGILTVHLGAFSGAGGQLGNNLAGAAVTYSIGALGGVAGFSGAIVDSVGGGGTTAITKTGPGLQIFSGANSYSGGTLVNDGTLRYDGTLTSGAGTVTVAGGTLAGVGALNRPVVVQAAGTLSPGASIGTLTINNTLDLGGNVIMEINKTGGVRISDRVQGVTTLTYGGTLTVTNSGEALVSGDSFTLFTASSYTASFTTLSLPALDAGLGWDTSRLTIDGTIRVADLYQVTGRVALDGYLGLAPENVGTRSVTFVAKTADGIQVGTWTLPLNFTNGVAPYTLPSVLGTVTNLSAKTAWNLRKRLPVLFTGGSATVDFTGASQLPAGDLDGSNSVGLPDYYALVALWYQPAPAGAAADIDGNGVVDVDDYFLLSSRWLDTGDVE